MGISFQVMNWAVSSARPLPMPFGLEFRAERLEASGSESGRPSKPWTLKGEVTGKFSKAFPPAFTRIISRLTRIRSFIPEKRYPCSF
jgi:hypothetical protein